MEYENGIKKRHSMEGTDMSLVFRTRWTVLVAILSVALSSTCFAQALVDRVPADAMIYVGWRGSQSLGAGYQGSNLRGFLAESQIPQFCDQFLPQLLDRIGRQDPNAAQAIAAFRSIAGPMWRHPSAFFFSGLDLNGDRPLPHMGMLCDGGDEADALQKQAQMLLQQAMQGGEPPFPIRVTRVSNLVALTVGYEKGEDALAGGANGGKGLSSDADFTAALADVSKDAVITGYIHFDKLVANLDQVVEKAAPPDAQQMWPKVKESLGLGSIKRVIWSHGFAGKDWETKLFVAAPEPRKGLLGKIISAAPLSNDIYAAIPQNATVAGAASFDASGLISAIRTAAGQIDPNVQQMIDQVLNQVSQTVGVDVEKDFLGSLGSQWAYYVDPSVLGRGMLGTTLVNHLKDPAKFEQSLTKLEGFANAMIAQQVQKDQVSIAFRETSAGQLMVHYLAVPLVTPSWAVQDGNLYVALYPQAVVAAAAQVSGKGKSILENPKFVAMQKRLGGSAAGSMQFLDLPSTAADNYGSWVALSRLSGFGDLFGVQSPPMLLPPVNRLMPHLSPAGQVTWTDAQGAHLHSLSPFPGSELLGGDPLSMGVAQEAMLAGFILPNLQRANVRAQPATPAQPQRQQ